MVDDWSGFWIYWFILFVMRRHEPARFALVFCSHPCSKRLFMCFKLLVSFQPEEKLRCNTLRLKPKDVLVYFVASQQFFRSGLPFNFANSCVIVPARSPLAICLHKLPKSGFGSAVPRRKRTFSWSFLFDDSNGDSKGNDKPCSSWKIVQFHD